MATLSEIAVRSSLGADQGEASQVAPARIGCRPRTVAWAPLREAVWVFDYELDAAEFQQGEWIPETEALEVFPALTVTFSEDPRAAGWQ